MSHRPSDSDKLKKKSKKFKRRNSGKKTGSTQSQVKDESSANTSKELDPPSTNIESVNSTILKWNQEEPRECDPYEDGDYAKMPYEAPNEVNFIGGIGGNIGHRRSKKYINRTTKIQQIYSMRNDNKTVFNFCEDPRVTSNVPSKGQRNENDRLLTDTVNRIGAIKHEQLSIEVAPDPSIDCTHVLEDYSDSNTHFNEDDYRADNEQNNFEIRKQFLDQKRTLLRQQLQTEIPQDFGYEFRKEKFKLSEYYDIDQNIPDGIDLESVREAKVDWSEKYKVDAHKCDLKFGRPMPDVIAMPLEREKLAFLTRTLDKPRIVEKLEEERREYVKPIEERVTIDYEHRETARELERILKKLRAENFSIDLALQDFDEFMKSAAALNVAGPKDDTNVVVSATYEIENLKSAKKAFEDRIANQLTEPEETTYAENAPNEESELTENIENYRKVASSQEIHFPIDFTYAFEKRQSKMLSRNELNEIESEETHRKVNESRTTTGYTKVKDVKKGESFCTNFTDDSGSFIVVQEKHLHLNRLKTTKKTPNAKTAKATNKFDEYLRPYEVLSLKEAKKMNQRDPKLVPTFDIKDRLKVDIPQYDAELIGVKDDKYLSQLATEWDEYYQKEIINRPRIRRFKPRTIMKQIVDSLRLKYESIYKREYLTEKTIVIEQEKGFTERAEQFRDFCMAFFSNLTTTNYRQSMAKIQDLRPMYELNDKLTSEHTSLENKLIQLKTAIIRAEGMVREGTILQNVSYLMKEPNWREKHDWIHKKSDGSLESIKESINKRSTTNLRKRDNDSVWAIKEFFENHIFTNKRPALVCFESPDAIVDTIANFKVQLYLSLLKLDLSTWTLINLQHAYTSYVKWSTDFIEHRKKYVEARCARKYFLDVCATNMKKDAVELINGKLVETISEKMLRTLEPLCNTLFVSVVPKNIQEQLEGGDILSKFRFIISHTMSMLGKLGELRIVRHSFNVSITQNEWTPYHR